MTSIGPNPSVSTPTGLRAQQKELARRLIVDATARVILRNRIHQFSMQEVADEAGLSLRTLYRYYRSREELLEGVGAEIDQVLREAGVPIALESAGTPEALATAVAEAFRLTERRGADLGRAWVILNMVTGARSASSQLRDRLVRDVVGQLGPHMDPIEQERAFGVIRYLAGSLAWKVMTDDLGMETEDVAKAVGWAVQTLLENVEAGDGPVDRD